MNNIFYKVIESVDKDFDIELVGKRTTNTGWSGIYLQTSISHALNYLEHKAYLTKHKYLLLVEMKTELKCIKIEDKIYGMTNISGEEKSLKLKQMFGINENLLLMDNMNNPLLLLDNEEEYELVVPHKLFNNDNFIFNILKKYSIETTSKYQIEMKKIKEI
jgi:hypothetical protein